ncbi:ABC transporter permease [Brevibacillus invocatus]|uniref:ABC transporter permease n=1 Tax=Brevibacillus invocatus TaxID=173959 RepID=UPI002041F88E|nr:ABC transporter permease [Brevibacillus invocatus]MCM3082049.1 ABC transporter permease [Brevibacillus invocatus]MCM3432460.1 ABC transporter permease [Brevibacillus invocatus]
MKKVETAVVQTKPAFPPLKPKSILFRRFISNRLAVIGAVCLFIIVFICVLAPLLTSHDPLEITVQDRLQPPSAEHWFGTDDFGRDLFSRVIYGSRVSMTVGTSVVIITSILGLIAGLYSAYYRRLDNFIMRINDGLMAFPAILLAIAIMAALGPKMINVIIALSIVYIPTVARSVRSVAITVREQTYIEAIRALGGKSTTIIWRHIAPNCLSPLIIQATFIFAYAVIIEASLSFLGAGTPPPEPSWGNILNDGRTVMKQAWWMTIFPGFAIMLTVLGLNLLGDGLRDLLDPHTNKAKAQE